MDFDADDGRFRLQHPMRGAAVLGDGRAARWTGRALERIGYRVVELDGEDRADLTVTVLTDGDQPSWRLSTGGRTRHYATIAALVAGISARHGPR